MKVRKGADSVYPRHFSPSPGHNNRQDLLGLERNEASGLSYGGASDRLLQGYKGEYRNKALLSRPGVGPVIIPGVGARFGAVDAEAVLLGACATMSNVGWRF